MAMSPSPGADLVNIENVAVDSDGTVALAIRAVAGRLNRGGGIALFDPKGKQSRFFDTGEYLPTQVAFGPDHSVWAIGYLGETAGANTRDYPILRKYAQDGQELGAFLPRSTFPYSEYAGYPQPLVMPFLNTWELRVVNDSVDVILSREKLWVETDLNRNEKQRWQIGPTDSPAGLTRTMALCSEQTGITWHSFRGINGAFAGYPRPGTGESGFYREAGSSPWVSSMRVPHGSVRYAVCRRDEFCDCVMS
jgi:hypothetical protein